MRIILKRRRPTVRRVLGLKTKSSMVIGLPDGEEELVCKSLAVGLSHSAWERLSECDMDYAAILGDGIYDVWSGTGHEWLFIKGQNSRRHENPFGFDYGIEEYIAEVQRHRGLNLTKFQGWEFLWQELLLRHSKVPGTARPQPRFSEAEEANLTDVSDL